MKKVILSKDESKIMIEDVSAKKFYGVEVNERFGFIARQDYGKGLFVVFCGASELTAGNNWDYFSSDDLKVTIAALVNDKNLVFEFETGNELFTWLAEKTATTV